MLKPTRKRVWIPLLVLLLFIVAASDFHRFVKRVGDLEAPENPKADAIVALTGGSGKRIKAAIALLQGGAGERLLVSGVHQSVDTADLIATAGGSQDLYDCCIDIGHIASSTEGNAIESGDWVKSHGYKSLIIVTSDYHMPRALVWYRHSIPDIEIQPYPMRSRVAPDQWWTSWRSFRWLLTEWAKWRVTSFLLAF